MGNVPGAATGLRVIPSPGATPQGPRCVGNHRHPAEPGGGSGELISGSEAV